MVIQRNATIVRTRITQCGEKSIHRVTGVSFLQVFTDKPVRIVTNSGSRVNR